MKNREHRKEKEGLRWSLGFLRVLSRERRILCTAYRWAIKRKRETKSPVSQNQEGSISEYFKKERVSTLCNAAGRSEEMKTEKSPLIH